MSWAEIKIAINGMLGRKDFKSLDDIIRQTTYEGFYDLLAIENGTTTIVDGKTNKPSENLTVGVVDRGLKDVINMNDIINADTETRLFKDDKDIKSVILPWGVDKTSLSCCNGANNLYHFSMPDTVKTISPYSFYKCTNLKSIKLSNHLKKIEDYAFASSGIKVIVLPDSLEEIADNAFQGCDKVIFLVPSDKFSDRSNDELWGATNSEIGHNYEE